MTETTPKRYPDKMSQDVTELHRLLDDNQIAHVSFIVDEQPYVLPVGFARLGNSIVIHGSTGSRWMRLLADGARAVVGVTSLGGIVVARSAFESSFHYRSAVIFGCFTQVAPERKPEVLNVLTDHFLPGRSGEVRPDTKKELAATLLLELEIDQWSLRISEEWPDDPQEDVDGPAWAGVVPLTGGALPPLPAPDLRPGIPVPASVTNLNGTLPAHE